MKYNPSKIEKKWQKIWKEQKLGAAEDFLAKKKYYCLFEFPYPSGAGLHVGHARTFVGTDVVARFRRMQGYNVLYPIGWDAFGLPTENFAIKNKIHPRVATDQNIKNFKKQMRALGISVDWNREIDTTDPKYYKWTQWIFLQLYKAGMAYRAEVPIHWCPSCKTGLANEEVIDGKHERCGCAVEEKLKKQWLIRITKYADRLIEDLRGVDFPERVKTQQINWIGKSIGAEIEFSLRYSSQTYAEKTQNNAGAGLRDSASSQRESATLTKVKVFTTRPDTLFGATYMVLAPEHPLVKNHKSFTLQNFSEEKLGRARITNYKQVEEYIKEAANKTAEERISEGKEKTGVELKGITAINPANNEEIPVWIADYVLGNVGTGAIMAVPAHDVRDFAFAKKYGLPIKMVVCPHYPAKTCPVLDEAYEGIGHLVDSGQFSGMESEKAKDAITKFVGGEKKVQYRLRDWVFSRQRYWGEPIPIVYCDACGVGDIKTKLIIDFHGEHSWNAIISGRKTIETRALYLPERKNLKIGDIVRLEDKTTQQIKIAKITEVHIFKTLSELFARQDLMKDIFPGETISNVQSLQAKYEMTDKGYLAKIDEYGLAAWRIELIHTEKIILVPEKDLPVLLPNVKNYEPTDTGESPLAAMKNFVETKCPVCGGPAKRETDTMPNWAGSNWYFLRYLDPRNEKAFADRKKIDYWMPVDLYNGGMEHTTLHLLYSRFIYKFLYDQKFVPHSEPYAKRTTHGIILAEDNRKMSKSFGNVINPDDIVKEYGADALRMYEMFIAPFDQAVAWNTQGVVGVRRFLDRVWKFYEAEFSDDTANDADRIVHGLVKKVGEDIGAMKFNTAISAFMEALNALEKCAAVSREASRMYLLALAPFAPHLAEELWQAHSAFGVQRSAFSFIHEQPWPEYNEALIRKDMFDLIVQVNGKMRATISLSVGASQEEAERVARQNEAVAKHLEGKTAKKIVFVQNRLINFVL
jgi:leucyl-tRNA synthetase